MNKHVCPVCGEELKEEDNYCPSCGASVKEEIQTEEKTSAKENFSQEVPAEKNKNRKKKSGKNSKQENEEPEIKRLSIEKLIYLIFGLVLVVLFINVAAGVFDQPAAVSGISSNNDSSNPHKGADLQNLQQINSLEEKVKNNPEDKASLLELAHLLNDSGFKERAIEKYKDYLKTDPKDADVLVDMGVCYYELGNYNEAIKQMKQAIKYQPKHQIAHLNLGIVNMTAGNHDEAIKWLKEAIAINPSTEIAKRAQELINSH